MTYSGNPSISPDVRQRILGTFDQTLQLASEGSRQEALLGCDFVLRMDPQFEPARVLQERLKSGTGAVQVDDLRNPGSAKSTAPDDPFADLDGLSLDLPDLHLGGSSDLRSQLQDLLDRRRFQELMAAAERERAAVTADPELLRIVQASQERMEAEPYVLKFLTAARQSQQAGHAEEVSRLLDKARSLDPGHPGIAELEKARGIRPAARDIQVAEEMQLPSPLQTTAMPASLAFGGGDSESDRRIQELLDEGQSALSSGDPQGAIDAWSRIFLIDIDHQEAARLIEAARKLKAENERQVEEIFHDGLASLEAGRTEAARRSFQRVLEIQPGYFAAREYLQQIEAGTAAAPRPAGARETTRAAPGPVVPLPSAVEVSGRDLKEEILVPPEPSGGGSARASAFRPPKKAAVAREGRARRLFILVGAPVLLLVGLVAWFASQQWDRLFPNSQEATVAAPSQAATSDPISRAERLYKNGKTDLALKQLQLIPAADPHYAEAQKLIAEWEAAASGAPLAAEATPQPPVDPAAPVAPAPAGPDRHQELLTLARQAHADRSYFQALKRLNQAAALAKLEGADAEMLADTQRKLQPIARELDLFRQHEWEAILPSLWRMHDANPGDRDVTQLIADSYYNLAIKDLQRNDVSKAAEKLTEAAKLQPNDEAIKRNLLFAQTYEQRPKDLLYRIYAKYLPFR
jgi:tetratricopeptide (TPR) repeat protein